MASSPGLQDGSPAAQPPAEKLAAQPLAEKIGTQPVQEAAVAEPSWDLPVSESVAAAWHELRGLVHEHLQLLALETQQAGRNLVWMFAFAVVASLLSAAAWFGLVAAGVLALVAAGISEPFATLAGAIVNALLAMALVLAIRRRSMALGFPATLRSIRPSPDAVTRQSS